jgi:hypothetical protein
MAEVNEAKLLKAVKGGASHGEAAEALGVTPGQLNMNAFCKAQVAAGLFSKIPATAASVKKARNSDGNRWELIAARAGISVAKVKDLYGGEDAAAGSFVGRGRNYSGSKPSAANRKRTTAAKSKPKGGKPKAKTLAQRRAGNPS